MSTESVFCLQRVFSVYSRVLSVCKECILSTAECVLSTTLTETVEGAEANALSVLVEGYDF